MKLREKAVAVFHILETLYPDARPFIVYRNPFELLIGVILSAQTTDRQVNEVTPELFSRYPDAESLARADLTAVETLVRSTGFFRMKARNIIGTARALVERFGGCVPATIEELVTLPGVGRKSANVIVGHCFDQPAIIVDTHFMRVTARLGVSDSRDPEKIEAQVRGYLPEAIATQFSMVINLHGRFCCTARKPACYRCPLVPHCDFPDKNLDVVDGEVTE